MTIKIRLISLIALFTLCIITNALLLLNWAQSSASYSTVINTAGKQRMLTQKMTAETLFSLKRSEFTEASLKTQFEFDNTLSALIDGDQERGIPKAENPELIQQLKQVQIDWRSLQEHIAETKRTGGSDNNQLKRLSEQSLITLKNMNSAVEMMEQDADDAIFHLESLIGLITLLGIGIAAAAYLTIRSAVLKPLKQFREITEAVVEQNDLTRTVGLADVTELGKTAASFDKMLHKFKFLNKEIEDVKDAINDTVDQINHSSEQNVSNVETQKTEIIELSTAINQMSQAFEEVSHNTKDASTLANDVHHVAEKGIEQIKQSIQTTYKLDESLDHASSNIDELSKASEAISNMADTISTIAEQTNLLALNAAIEAARAGEQGRGFAVVADEVRTLASRTQTTTNEIHQSLSHLQASMGESLQSVHKIKQFSTHNVSQAEATSDSIQQIINAITELGTINGEIANASAEHESVARQVNDQIQMIAEKADATYQSTEQSYAQAKALTSLSDKLANKVNVYKT